MDKRSRHSREASLCRVLVSAGGTGGHIFPAIAVAEYLEKYFRCELMFVGAVDRMEMKIVPSAGFRIEGLPIRGFQRGHLLANISLPIRLVRSLVRAYRILQRFRPHVLFGTGGYASLPIMYVGALCGFPTLILEPNALAGWANRYLGRYVSKVCVSYPKMEKFFPKSKLLQTGTPLRTSLNYVGTSVDARQRFGLKDRPTLLAVGGSLGSDTLNRCMLIGWQQLLSAGYQIIWQTGSSRYKDIRNTIGQIPSGLSVLPFIDNIGRSLLSCYACSISSRRTNYSRATSA